MSAIQSYQFNNKTVEVNLAEAPELSSVSKEILENLHCDFFPSPFQTARSLKDRIQSIKETASMLETTQDPTNNYKLKAFLKLVIVVVIAVSAVLIFSYMHINPWRAGFLFYLIFNVSLTQQYANVIIYIEKRNPHYQGHFVDGKASLLLKFFFGAIVLPLFEAFTREARIKRVLEEQEADIRGILNDYKAQNDKVLPSAHRFYQARSAALTSSLNRKISLAQADLAKLNQAEVPNQVDIGKVETFITTRETALEELQILASFYQQWDS